MLYFTGDGDDDFALFPPSDPLDHLCVSDEPPPPTVAAMGPPSLSPPPLPPPLSDGSSSPGDAPNCRHQGLLLPPDFELRESDVPGGGTGVWSRRRVAAGERFGPAHQEEPGACHPDSAHSWEVG